MIKRDNDGNLTEFVIFTNCNIDTLIWIMKVISIEKCTYHCVITKFIHKKRRSKPAIDAEPNCPLKLVTGIQKQDISMCTTDIPDHRLPSSNSAKTVLALRILQCALSTVLVRFFNSWMYVVRMQNRQLKTIAQSDVKSKNKNETVHTKQSHSVAVLVSALAEFCLWNCIYSHWATAICPQISYPWSFACFQESGGLELAEMISLNSFNPLERFVCKCESECASICNFACEMREDHRPFNNLQNQNETTISFAACRSLNCPVNS